MNLLITNSQEFQAYAIARSLQADADRIIVTEGGDSVASNGFRGLAFYSRFVDARYRVPHFSGDWLAGRLEDENTEAEEAYIQRIEEICVREHVDVIFPSLDPEIYVFAKNKRRLQEQGVLAVVPEPGVIRVPMDKALTIQAAQRVGFPCPKTYLPASDGDIDQIIRDSSPPWIVKPRFTAHGANMVYASEPAQLRTAVARVSTVQQAPIVQEYIPQGLRRNYYLMVGKDSEIISLLSPDVVRAQRSGYKVSSKTAISASSGPSLPELRALVRELRLWGAYTVQTQIDPRDGVAKLLEINARFGHHLWWRTGLGVNEPLIFLQLAQGKAPTGNLRFPEGVILLDPINDLFHLCDQVVLAVRGVTLLLLGRGSARSGEPGDVNPRGVLETLRAYRRDYVNGRRKVFCPEFRNLLDDPSPCIRFVWFKTRVMVGHYLSYLRPGRTRCVASAS